MKFVSQVCFQAVAIATFIATGSASEKKVGRKIRGAASKQAKADDDTPRELNPIDVKDGSSVEAVNAGNSSTIEFRVDGDEAPIAHAAILGGNLAEAGSYPYFVSMGGCGGSLIAPTVVLTAAHCNSDYFIGKTVQVGATKRWDITNENFKASEEIKVIDGKSHPRFGKNSFLNNDFALLLLEKPYAMDTDIKLVLNDDFAFPPSGDMVDVIGMGSVVTNEPQINELHEVALPVITNSQCNEYYGGGVKRKAICAGYRKGEKDACHGDSGGPLLKRNGNTHILVGIVSYGVGCTRFPGVYARVSEGLKWIEKQVCDTWKVGSAQLCTDRKVDAGGGECSDDPSFAFQGNTRKNCAWAAKKPTGKRGRCGKRKVYKSCRVTCGKC